MVNRIMIDAGHNGVTDPGAVFQDRKESDDALRLALAVGKILTENGYDVSYTRTGELPQTVQQKAQLANDAQAELFLSIHRNKAANPGQYNGVQTLIYDWEGWKPQMAQAINQNLEALGFRNISVETRPNLAVLRRTKMPALLVEAGFIDSEKDNQLFDTRFQEIAQAIADGVMETLRPSGLNTQNPQNFPVPPVWSGMPLPPAAQENRPLYRVQVGAFYNLQNAVQLEQELRQLGYNTWIVTM